MGQTFAFSWVKTRAHPLHYGEVRLGAGGVEQVMGLGRMTPFERAGLEKMLPELAGSIVKGVDFVKK